MFEAGTAAFATGTGIRVRVRRAAFASGIRVRVRRATSATRILRAFGDLRAASATRVGELDGDARSAAFKHTRRRIGVLDLGGRVSILACARLAVPWSLRAAPWASEGGPESCGSSLPSEHRCCTPLGLPRLARSFGFAATRLARLGFAATAPPELLLVIGESFRFSRFARAPLFGGCRSVLAGLFLLCSVLLVSSSAQELEEQSGSSFFFDFFCAFGVGFAQGLLLVVECGLESLLDDSLFARFFSFSTFCILCFSAIARSFFFFFFPFSFFSSFASSFFFCLLFFFFFSDVLEEEIVGELGLEIGLDEELSPLYDELRVLSLRAGAARSSGRGPGGGHG